MFSFLFVCHTYPWALGVRMFSCIDCRFALACQSSPLRWWTTTVCAITSTAHAPYIP